MKIRKRIFGLILLSIFSLVLVACGDTSGNNNPPSVQKYVVTFNVDGGISVPSIEREENKAIGTLPTTSKDGFMFDGWFSDSAKTVSVTGTELVTNNMTLYAKWTESIDVLIAHINSNSNNVLNGYKTIRYYTNDAYNTYYDLYVGNTKTIRIQYTTSSRTYGFSFIFMFDLGQITNGTFVGTYPDPIGMKFYELFGHASYNTSTKTVSIVPIPSASSLPSGMYSSSLNLATLCLPDVIEYYKSKVFNPLGITLN